MDEKLCKDWIKNFNSDAPVWAFGESLYYEGQAKWQGKKENFQRDPNHFRTKVTPHVLGEDT